MTIEELSARVDALERAIAEIKLQRFDQAYPPGHSEREERLRKLKPTVDPKGP